MNSTHTYCIYHHPCKGEIVKISKKFKIAPSAIHIKLQLSTFSSKIHNQ